MKPWIDLILFIALAFAACAPAAKPVSTSLQTSTVTPSATFPPSPTTARAPSPTSAMATTTPAAMSGMNHPSIPSCPTDLNEPLFNTLPIAIDDFIAFRPLDWLFPPIHIFPAKHSAFSMTLPGQKPKAQPVLAPGRVWVAEIWEASFSTGGANYQVFVYPCREVRVYLGTSLPLRKNCYPSSSGANPNAIHFLKGRPQSRRAGVMACRSCWKRASRWAQARTRKG